MGSDGTRGHREESGLSFTVANDTKLKAKWLQVRERGSERETMEHNSHLVSSKSSMIRVHLPGFENTGDKITTLCLSVSHSLLVPGHLQTVFLPAAKKVGAASAPSKAKF